MSINSEISQIAVKFFIGILPLSAVNNGFFKALITAQIGEEAKPLLLVGTAHSRVEDGSVIAFLNPDISLVVKIKAGGGYDKWRVTELARGSCDAAVKIWVDAYKKKNFYIQKRYRTRVFKPAKFVVT